MKPLRWIGALCLFWSLLHSSLFACRYNVRDVGFVDLGRDPLFLYLFIGEETPEEFASTFREISYPALLDGNVRVEILNVNEQKSHPALKHLDQWGIRSLPAAVLASPQGQSIRTPLPPSWEPLKETIWRFLESLVSSPLREEILKQLPHAYGVVLLMEGPHAQENKDARRAASKAIEEIRVRMNRMPKAIAAPPALVVLPQSRSSQERILLWSLGLDPHRAGTVHAAVLYGRARRMGPILKGKEVTEGRLFTILSFIGADCECELDRTWVQGPMLPVRWNEAIQSQAAQSLGFDPESPMVKLEVSQILRQGFYSGFQGGFGSFPDEPLGYQEFAVEFKAQGNPEGAAGKALPQGMPPEPAPGKASDPDPQEGEHETALLSTALLFGGLCLLILAAGVAVVLASQKRPL